MFFIGFSGPGSGLEVILLLLEATPLFCPMMVLALTSERELEIEACLWIDGVQRLHGAV